MSLAPLSAGHSLCYPQSIGPLWCRFPSGWICVRSRTLWVSPTNSPVRLAVSPAAASTPTDVFNQWFDALFPHVELWVAWSVAQSASYCLTGQLQLCLPQSTALLCPPAVDLLAVLSAWLPISPPSTGLDECFFFICLVVGLPPYSSIFCQFWLFFVFKLLLSFWLCKEAQCVYLRLHLGLNLISDWF